MPRCFCAIRQLVVNVYAHVVGHETLGPVHASFLAFLQRQFLCVISLLERQQRRLE